MSTTITLVLGGLLVINLIGLAAALETNNHFRKKVKYLESSLSRVKEQARRETVAARRQKQELTELTDRKVELERSLYLTRRALKELEEQHERLRRQFRLLVQLEERRN